MDLRANEYNAHACLSVQPIVGADVRSFESERKMLLAWAEFLRACDPDIITGACEFGLRAHWVRWSDTISRPQATTYRTSISRTCSTAPKHSKSLISLRSGGAFTTSALVRAATPCSRFVQCCALIVAMPWHKGPSHARALTHQA